MIKEKLKSLAKRVIDFLSKPFREELPFMILLIILISGIGIYRMVDKGLYPYAFYILAFGITAAFILSIIPSRLRQPSKYIYIYIYIYIRRIYKTIILAPLLTVFTIDCFCAFQLGISWSNNVIAAFAATNPQEASEFFDSQISPLFLIGIILFFISSAAFYLISTRKNIALTSKGSYIGIAIVLISSTLVLRNPLVIIDTPFHLIGLLLNSNAPELKPYFTNPSLTSDNNKPRNVVLIIGESFWRKHSSLYGYEKPTNPLLEHLEKDSSAFIFNNITSAETHTQEAFKNLLSTFSSHSDNTIKWYEHTTLNEIASLMGYKSYWISNQLRKGVYDNIVSRYAELCDHQLYTQDENGFKKPKFDIDIIPLIKSLKKAQYCFHVVNLMGSHATFSSRFPSSFAKFKATDYMEHPEHQRQTIADYDNSILYNDYVVSEIINLFKDKEAIVVYLSDHSIDLYQSDPNYAAHAKPGNAISEKVGREIPFMIYMSRAYQEKYPEMVEAVKRNLNSPFRTDDLIYTMMDIMGCDFADEPMRSRSLLRQN